MPLELEPIFRRNFPQPDRAEVQERIAQLVERDPEPFLARYVNDPRSLGGRYVNSDLIKETFDEYRQSPETRNRYNAPVHNAAAVLASEQFRRVINDASDAQRDVAVFLTGIPGAGKTTYVLLGGELPNCVRVVYEGQLANPDQAIPKIRQALDAGLHPEITVVHMASERALRNTLHRFETEGRGASIEAMASIQGRLPAGLGAIHQSFGDKVDLHIVDRRGTITTELRGWQHLAELESEGTYEDIKRNLANILENNHAAGRITEEAYEQAIGKAPRDFPGRLAQKGRSGPERSEDFLSQGLVKPSPDSKPFESVIAQMMAELPGHRTDRPIEGTTLAIGETASGRIVAQNDEHLALAITPNSYLLVPRTSLAQTMKEGDRLDVVKRDHGLEIRSPDRGIEL